jgi:molecular chaperone HtpG
MPTGAEHRFQVNLQGIIDLLANHLYSSPTVFVRELLQNAADAISARLAVEPSLEPRITFVCSGEHASQLTICDNGIGLTLDEVHQFLATIGETSKHQPLEEQRTDFIGQFGIGLLSCFLVSDEIEVVTRSAVAGTNAVRWCGNHDGTYAVRELDGEHEAGTRVNLKCRHGCEQYFNLSCLTSLLDHFGCLLPYPILVETDGSSARINDKLPPWRRKWTDEKELCRELALYGETALEQPVLDAFPLHSTDGGLSGAAFVLGQSTPTMARMNHRVYLKGMLITDKDDRVVPDWAFFVRCIVDASDLRATASREDVYEDDALDTAREEIGRHIKSYLVRTANEQPAMLQALIRIHLRALQAAALEDDDLLALFLDWMEFDTSFGRRSFKEIRECDSVIRYSPNIDKFRQIAPIAAAQGLLVVNGGYLYDAELIERAPMVFVELEVEQIDSSWLAEELEELGFEDRERYFDFVHQADQALAPQQCRVELKRFVPAAIPALFEASDHYLFRRSLDQARDLADGILADVLGDLRNELPESTGPSLILNLNNPLVFKVAGFCRGEHLSTVVNILYAQALLMGHYPLRGDDLALLQDNLMALIDISLAVPGEAPS